MLLEDHLRGEVVDRSIPWEPGLARPFRIPGGLAGTVALSIPPAALVILACWWSRAEPAALGMTVAELAVAVAALGVLWWFAGRGAATQRR